MKKRVADIIMETLVENDIVNAFCVVGGGSMYLNNAIGINPNINVIFNHHEQACAMACEGYTRTCGKMALCLVTSGPGGTNAITGVMGAYQDSVPMIVISGQVRYTTTVAESGLNLRRRGEQEFDIVCSVKNMTKYAKMVIEPLSIKREVQYAIDIALNGRRGPVWLDIPLDVQSAEIEEAELLPNLPSPETIKCTNKDFEELKVLIKNAKSPCFLAGSAIASTHSQEIFLKVLEKWQIPTVTASLVCNVLYNEHTLYFGTTGGIGTRAGNFVMQNSDVLIVLGSSLGYKQTTFDQSAFAPNSKIIMIDVNPDEAKKPGLNIYKFIHSDILYVFDKILDDEKICVDIAWLKYCNNLKNKFNFFENAIGNPKERVNSYNFWREYNRQVSNDNLTILGNSSSMVAGWQYGKYYNKQIRFTNINCGSMGYDLPASIGAAVASGMETFMITGDGSFMMNLQELQTVKYNKLLIKFVIFSNDGYCGIKQTYKNYFDGINVGCDLDSGLSMPDFKKIAYAFDIKYKKCATNSKLKSSISWLLKEKGSCMLEILQQYDNPALPIVKPKLQDGENKKTMLQDMFPFLDRAIYMNCEFNKGE